MRVLRSEDGSQSSTEVPGGYTLSAAEYHSDYLTFLVVAAVETMASAEGY
jgi:hypothetical protein